MNTISLLTEHFSNLISRVHGLLREGVFLFRVFLYPCCYRDMFLDRGVRGLRKCHYRTYGERTFRSGYHLYGFSTKLGALFSAFRRSGTSRKKYLCSCLYSANQSITNMSMSFLRFYRIFLWLFSFEHYTQLYSWQGNEPKTA